MERSSCLLTAPALILSPLFTLTQSHARPGAEDGDGGGDADPDEREDLADGGLRWKKK